MQRVLKLPIIQIPFFLLALISVGAHFYQVNQSFGSLINCADWVGNLNEPLFKANLIMFYVNSFYIIKLFAEYIA